MDKQTYIHTQTDHTGQIPLIVPTAQPAMSARMQCY